MVAVETLHSQTMEAHVTGQVVSPEISSEKAHQRAEHCGFQLLCYSLVNKPNSHNFLANKDEDFILWLHVSDEVKHVGLFLLFMDNQHCLLNCVNRLNIETSYQKEKSLYNFTESAGILAYSEVNTTFEIEFL